MFNLEKHTFELKPSQEAVEQAVKLLRERGWEIYNERVPLSGQFGYFCVRVFADGSGKPVQHAHSVRWNLFGKPLIPVTIDCLDDRAFLSFLWQHATHENFSFFDYQDGDVGFVCYCGGESGYSTVLRVSEEFEPGIGDLAFDILEEYIGMHVVCDLDDEDDEDD